MVSPSPAAEQQQSIRDDWDTIPDGVQGRFTGRPGCTLGVTATVDGVAGVIASSHCSLDPYDVDSGDLQQSTTGPVVGSEAWDKPGVVGFQFGAAAWGLSVHYCPFPFGCRYSDAQWTEFDHPESARHGRIARTLVAGHPGIGSHTVDQNRPYFGVATDLPFSQQVVGLWVSKMGMVTGWTRGQITDRCVYIPPGVATPDALMLACQNVTNAHSDDGDSGSPYFLDGGTASEEGPWDWVYLLGVHFGRLDKSNANSATYSTIQGVRFDFSSSGSSDFETTLYCFAWDNVHPC